MEEQEKKHNQDIKKMYKIRSYWIKHDYEKLDKILIESSRKELFHLLFLLVYAISSREIIELIKHISYVYSVKE